MWEKFIQQLIKLGVIAEDKQDQATEIGQQMDKESTPRSEPTRTQPGMIPADQVDALITKAVSTAISPLQKQLDEEKEARKALEAARADQQAKDLAAQVKGAIEKAEKEGRITSAEAREKWTKRLEENFESWSEALGELPANPSVNRTDAKDDAGKKTAVSASAGERERVDQTAVYEAAVTAFSAGKE